MFINIGQSEICGGSVVGGAPMHLDLSQGGAITSLINAKVQLEMTICLYEKLGQTCWEGSNTIYKFVYLNLGRRQVIIYGISLKGLNTLVNYSKQLLGIKNFTWY